LLKRENLADCTTSCRERGREWVREREKEKRYAAAKATRQSVMAFAGDESVERGNNKLPVFIH
jgi:hypothetical protein